MTTTAMNPSRRLLARVSLAALVSVSLVSLAHGVSAEDTGLYINFGHIF